MFKKISFTLLFSLYTLQTQSMENQLPEPLSVDAQDEQETLRGQKCECFCSLTVAEDATIGNNLTVNGALIAGDITAPGGTVDGDFIVNNSSVNGLFNVSQYYFAPEITRACPTGSQTVDGSTYIQFPNGTVTNKSKSSVRQRGTDSTTFYFPNTTLTARFSAVIQLDSSTTGAQIEYVIFEDENAIVQHGIFKQPSGKNQIILSGTYIPYLLAGKIRFLNRGRSPICITSANVTFQLLTFPY